MLDVHFSYRIVCDTPDFCFGHFTLSVPPVSAITCDHELAIGSEVKRAFNHANADVFYRVECLQAIWTTDLNGCFHDIYRPDWFSYFIPDDAPAAIQTLSELGLTEYAMDLIRQAKDAGFIEDVPCSEPLRL